MSKIAVVYWSGTGNTEAMANEVAEGAKAAGAEVDVLTASEFGADKMDDKESEALSNEIATKIQNEMTYPGQVKITVIRETRSIAYAK